MVRAGRASVTAIHLLALAQAADLTGVELLGPTGRAAPAAIRAHAAFLDADRPMDTDIETVAALVRAGDLRPRHPTLTRGTKPCRTR